jgi:host factor-I protein
MDNFNRKSLRPPVSAETTRSAAPRKTAAPARKQGPPEQTYAENFYYLKQMQSKTPMKIMLTDGEELQGVIEWYDKGSIKVNRVDAPNLLVFKHCIKYMHKADED